MRIVPLMRIVAGIVIAIGGGYLAAPSPSPVPFPIMIVLTAFTAGLVMGTWWSGILVPVGILMGLFAWHSVENAVGPDGGRTPIEIQILLGAAFYGGIAAVAVFGTLISRIARILQQRAFS